jgi:branched-subunit amino acid transport protein AzlD
MLVIYVAIVGIYMCHIFPYNILVTRDLGRILVIFYVMLSLPSLGLTMRIG